jgi:hypothetical protein
VWEARRGGTTLAYEPEPAVCGTLGNIAAAYRHATGAEQWWDNGEAVKPLTNLRTLSKRNRFCLVIVGLGLPERGAAERSWRVTNLGGHGDVVAIGRDCPVSSTLQLVKLMQFVLQRAWAITHGMACAA